MKLFQPSKDNLDEVVFENRNKLYGAYAIRKDYDANLTKATISSFLLLIFLVAGLHVASYFKSDIPEIIPSGSGPGLSDKPIEILTNINIVPDNPIGAITQNVNTGVFQIIRDHLMPPPQRDPVEPPANPTGGQQGTGPSGPDMGGGGTPGTGGLGEGGGPSEPIIETPQEPVTFAEHMPAFPGGMDKLADFLQHNIKYPGNAREIGLEGKVVVSFVVNKNGEISDIKLRKAIGFGFDDEAMRVVAAMPKWTPGSQNGKTVPVQMILPVVFKLH
jgi:protein TonB